MEMDQRRIAKVRVEPEEEAGGNSSLDGVQGE
jgi:hypothetical protein